MRNKITSANYYAPTGGLPAQTDLMTGRAVFTEAYALIPKGVLRDIVTSYFPFWSGTRGWIIARPMTGFSETFSHYILEIQKGGGSDRPDTETGVESVIFVVDGEIEITLSSSRFTLRPGGYAYIPVDTDWSLRNNSDTNVSLHWLRKGYEFIDGIPAPDPFVTNEQDVKPIEMPGTAGVWTTTRFVPIDDLRHDMHVNIVNFEPGGVIPFEETHVMEHGLYVLEGKGVYKLNRDWVEVEAGDYMWLRAFCPQACYAAGPSRFRYLLYKDVNRHPKVFGLAGFGR